jgi:hypothetical protein
VGIIVTADKLKVKKEISSETFVATFVVVFTAMGRMMSGYSSVRSLQPSRGPPERDVSDTKVDKYSAVADDDIRDIIFDKVVVNRGDTPILKELSIKISGVDGDYRSCRMESRLWLTY